MVNIQGGTFSGGALHFSGGARPQNAPPWLTCTCHLNFLRLVYMLSCWVVSIPCLHALWSPYHACMLCGLHTMMLVCWVFSHSMQAWYMVTTPCMQACVRRPHLMHASLSIWRPHHACKHVHGDHTMHASCVVSIPYACMLCGLHTMLACCVVSLPCLHAVWSPYHMLACMLSVLHTMLACCVVSIPCLHAVWSPYHMLACWDAECSPYHACIICILCGLHTMLACCVFSIPYACMLSVQSAYHAIYAIWYIYHAIYAIWYIYHMLYMLTSYRHIIGINRYHRYQHIWSLVYNSIGI